MSLDYYTIKKHFDESGFLHYNERYSLSNNMADLFSKLVPYCADLYFTCYECDQDSFIISVPGNQFSFFCPCHCFPILASFKFKYLPYEKIISEESIQSMGWCALYSVVTPEDVLSHFIENIREKVNPQSVYINMTYQKICSAMGSLEEGRNCEISGGFGPLLNEIL